MAGTTNQIQLKLHPNAKKKGAKLTAGKLDVYVHAVPEKNKANKELIELLAKAWRIPKSNLAVTKGATTRNKTITVTGDSRGAGELIELLVKEAGI